MSQRAKLPMIMQLMLCEGDAKIERWTTATRVGGGGVGAAAVLLGDDLRCEPFVEVRVARVVPACVELSAVELAELEVADVELAELEPAELEPPEPET
jgi:hypothetical protein